MIALIYLMIIFIISNCIQNIFKIESKYTILLSTACIYILLYCFGIFDLLKIGNYCIYAISIVGLLYLIYLLCAKKKRIKDLVSPVFIYYAIFSLIIYFVVINAKFTQWDEFSHWGTNLKFVFNKDHLWASRLWEGVHEAYPPLTGIIEYFLLKIHNSYNESIAFYALDLFMLAMITPILKDDLKINSIIKNILFILCLYMIILIFGFGLNSTYIDLPLGVLFVSGLYIAITMKAKYEKVILGIVLFMLPIFKDTGVIMAGVILLYLFIDAIYGCIKIKRFNLKYFVPIIQYLAIVCFSYLSWKVYCNINGTAIDFRHDSNAIATFDLKEYIKSIFLCTSGKNYDISLSFYNYLNSGSIINAPYPFQTIIQLIIVGNLMLIIMKHLKVIDNKKSTRLLLSLNIGIFGYLLFLLLVYLFVMLEPEGRTLASISRYISTYFICWFIVIISMCLDYKKSLVPIFICFGICLYGTNIVNFIKPISKNIDVIPGDVYKMYDAIDDHINTDDKIFIVLQNDGGYKFHTLRYLLSPVQTNLLYEWHLGDNNTTAYLAVFDLTPKEFIKELKNRKYTHVYLGIVDEEFVEEYGDLFKENATVDSLTNKLYKFDFDKNEYRFTEVN